MGLISNGSYANQTRNSVLSGDRFYGQNCSFGLGRFPFPKPNFRSASAIPLKQIPGGMLLLPVRSGAMYATISGSITLTADPKVRQHINVNLQGTGSLTASLTATFSAAVKMKCFMGSHGTPSKGDIASAVWDVLTSEYVGEAGTMGRKLTKTLTRDEFLGLS